MKVWLDVLTPKQANLFAELHDRLNAKGCKVLVTTRHYREVNELLELRKLKASKVGRHGGANLKDKLHGKFETSDGSRGGRGRLFTGRSDLIFLS